MVESAASLLRKILCMTSSLPDTSANAVQSTVVATPESGAPSVDTVKSSAPAVGTQVGSASDQRTVNNTMRHTYKVLDYDVKTAMTTVKDKGLELFQFIDSLGKTRELSVAKTKVEEAVMWAVKHITG